MARIQKHIPGFLLPARGTGIPIGDIACFEIRLSIGEDEAILLIYDAARRVRRYSSHETDGLAFSEIEMEF